MSIVQDPVAENLLFLGTDQGLYVSVDYGSTWTKWDRDFPSVAVSDLKIHPREHDLIVGTFGRALWVLDDIRPLRMFAQQGKQLLEKPFFMLPITDAIEYERTAISGERFNGADEFVGRNKRRGSIVNVYIKLPGKGNSSDSKEKKTDKKGKKKSKEKSDDESLADKVGEDDKADPRGVKKMGKGKKDVIDVHVLSLNGDSIRHYSTKPDTGFVRFGWGFDRDGTHFPRYKKFPRPLNTPRGPSMPPGEYKMVLTYGMHRDSMKFKISADPRHTFDPAASQVREEMIEDYLQHARAATKAFEQLRDARLMMDRFEKLWENASKGLQDSLKKVSKPIRDSIKVMQEVYLCLLYTSPSPRDLSTSRMPSSA